MIWPALIANVEAALIGLQLALPLAVLWVSARHLTATVVSVFLGQCLLVWLGGCLSFAWQCPSVCHRVIWLCESLGDDHDAAPFGIALLALVSFAWLVIAWMSKVVWIRWRGARRR
jgi:hypothetical protein